MSDNDNIIDDSRDEEDTLTPSPPNMENDEASPTQADGDEGTITERIMRRRRNRAAVVAPDLLHESTLAFCDLPVLWSTA
eukprot:6209358-Pleurochrysis_carterae.AAC.1